MILAKAMLLLLLPLLPLLDSCAAASAEVGVGGEGGVCVRRREEVAPRLFTHGRKTSLARDAWTKPPDAPLRRSMPSPGIPSTPRKYLEYRHFSFTNLNANSLRIFLAITSQSPNVSMPRFLREMNTLMASTTIHHLTCKTRNTHQYFNRLHCDSPVCLRS